MAQIGQVKPTTAAEAWPLLANLGDHKTDTTAGIKTLAEVLQGAAYFVLEVDGQNVMAWALDLEDTSHGRTVWIKAAAGHVQGIDLTATAAQAIEQQAAAVGAQQVALHTRRRGLIRKMQRQGYHITGVTLRKSIT